MSLTLDKFFNRFRQSAISSLDSRAQMTQLAGGFKYLEKMKKSFARAQIISKMWWCIPFAKSAEVNNNLLRDVLCDVNLRPEARHTHV